MFKVVNTFMTLGSGNQEFTPLIQMVRDPSRPGVISLMTGAGSYFREDRMDLWISTEDGILTSKDSEVPLETSG